MTSGQMIGQRRSRWHDTCRHRSYGLSCEEYVELVEYTGNRCQLCDTTPQEMFRGKLHIDHDCRVGEWAVRGLLCNTCNSAFRVTGGAPTPSGRAYLADAWYKRLLVRAGVPDRLAEPEPETIVCIGSRRFHKVDDLWRPMQKGFVASYPWDRLHYRFGPRAIKFTTPPP